MSDQFSSGTLLFMRLNVTLFMRHTVHIKQEDDTPIMHATDPQQVFVNRSKWSLA